MERLEDKGLEPEPWYSVQLWSLKTVWPQTSYWACLCLSVLIGKWSNMVSPSQVYGKGKWATYAKRSEQCLLWCRLAIEKPAVTTTVITLIRILFTFMSGPAPSGAQLCSFVVNQHREQRWLYLGFCIGPAIHHFSALWQIMLSAWALVSSSVMVLITVRTCWGRYVEILRESLFCLWSIGRTI